MKRCFEEEEEKENSIHSNPQHLSGKRTKNLSLQVEDVEMSVDAPLTGSTVASNTNYAINSGTYGSSCYVTAGPTVAATSQMPISAPPQSAPPTFLDVRLDYDLHPGLMKRFLNGSFH